MTTAEDIIKFRDAKNNAIVLCEYIPANGDKEERWQQYYLNMGDYNAADVHHIIMLPAEYWLIRIILVI